MLKLASQSIKVLHIESTDACNAACPQCARETDITFNKNDLHHLTIEQIKNLVDKDTIRNLDKMFMCGNYGDPAAGKNTLEIFRYFREINPTIILGMNTNGGLRSIEWWQELAEIFKKPGEYPQEYVVWSIDGLDDTNHIYRVNVNWNKVMENAQAFISAGGRAHWEMLIFQHNQHQVGQAETLAKELGFTWFRAKVSRRFNRYPVNFLQPPIGWQDPVVDSTIIDCQAIKDQSVYISAQGKIYPCCWLGNSESFTLENFDSVQSSWESSTPNQVCKSTCGKNNIGTSFINQWQREVEF